MMPPFKAFGVRRHLIITPNSDLYVLVIIIYLIIIINTSIKVTRLDPQKLFPRKLVEGQSMKIVLLENLAPYSICVFFHEQMTVFVFSSYCMSR